MAWVWRLVTERRATDPWSGEGARLYGGRWNRVGIDVIYTSQHRSLAALEILVHLGGIAPAGRYRFLSYEIEEAMTHHLRESDLPPDWREEPPPYSTGVLGSQWATERRSLAFSIPSAVVPEERNIVLNPHHADARRVRLGNASGFVFDPRLFALR